MANTFKQLALAEWELAMPPMVPSPSSPIDSLDWGSLDLNAEERGGSLCARSPLTSNPQSGRMLRSLLAAATDAFACRLQRDLTFLCTHPGASDPVTLASHLTSAGYSASVRRAVGGGGSSCFRNLRHEFLVVKGDGKDSRDDYVVDLRFREQFQISHPTPDYAALLALLPEAYAGPVSAVMPIVQLMCGEMAESFKKQGLALPPWRRTQSMLSKWLPAHSCDITMASSSASGAMPMEEGSPVCAAKAAPVHSHAFPMGFPIGSGASGAVPIRIPQASQAQHMVKFGFAI